MLLTSHLKPGLKILFVGINPGTRSAAIGHHFAGHSNRFWKLLADSGLTPLRLDTTADQRLLEFDFGITNLVARSSATAAELTSEELRVGADRLRKLLQEHQPQAAAYLGKVVYQYLARKREFAWGQQPQGVVAGVTDFVLPNPSGLNRMKFEEQLRYFVGLKEFLDGGRSQ